MSSKNRKEQYVIGMLFVYSLMNNWYAWAENEMVAVPIQGFGLQAKVQTTLIKQIDGQISATLAEHIAQQENKQSVQKTVDNRIEKTGDDRRLAGSLIPGP